MQQQRCYWDGGWQDGDGEFACYEIDRVMEELKNPENVAHQIEPGLWLGSEEAVLNQDFLTLNKVTHILNFGATNSSQNKPLGCASYSYFKIEDEESADIFPLFAPAYELIKAALEDMKPPGVVLVHCRMGISRSATIVASYLMKKMGWRPKTALDHIKSKRDIYPNSGFLLQLDRWHATLQ